MMHAEERCKNLLSSLDNKNYHSCTDLRIPSFTICYLREFRGPTWAIGSYHTQGIDKRQIERACKHGVMQSVDLMAKTGTVRMMLINIILAEAVAAAVAFLL